VAVEPRWVREGAGWYLVRGIGWLSAQGLLLCAAMSTFANNFSPPSHFPLLYPTQPPHTRTHTHKQTHSAMRLLAEPARPHAVHRHHRQPPQPRRHRVAPAQLGRPAAARGRDHDVRLRAAGGRAGGHLQHDVQGPQPPAPAHAGDAGVLRGPAAERPRVLRGQGAVDGRRRRAVHDAGRHQQLLQADGAVGGLRRPRHRLWHRRVCADRHWPGRVPRRPRQQHARQRHVLLCAHDALLDPAQRDVQLQRVRRGRAALGDPAHVCAAGGRVGAERGPGRLRRPRVAAAAADRRRVVWWR